MTTKGGDKRRLVIIGRAGPKGKGIDMDDGIIEVDSELGRTMGFTSDVWAEDSYLWKMGRDIWISLIISLRPRNGNLRRLFEAILKQGYGIAVPTPLGLMNLILLQWGFVRREGATCPDSNEPLELFCLEAGSALPRSRSSLVRETG